jgi:hypothetical protein
MSLSGSRSRLSALTMELSGHWQQTKNSWRDAKSLEFERRYLEELFVRVDRAIGVMEKLDEVLAKVKKDCE